MESAQPTSTQDEEPSSVGAPAPSATSPDVTTHMPSESVIHETSYSVASAGATGDVKAALDALRGQYDVRKERKESDPPYLRALDSELSLDR